jgi:hypothetical protein
MESIFGEKISKHYYSTPLLVPTLHTAVFGCGQELSATRKVMLQIGILSVLNIFKSKDYFHYMFHRRRALKERTLNFAFYSESNFVSQLAVMKAAGYLQN